MKEKNLYALAGVLIVVLIIGMFLLSQQESLFPQYPENGKKGGKELIVASPDWPGGSMKSYVLEKVIEERIKGINVTLKALDGPECFKGLKTGEVDVFIEAWLPRDRKEAIENIEHYKNLGPNYHEAVLAYGIPSFTSKKYNITKISDLKGKDDIFDDDDTNEKGEIYSIKPDSQMCRDAKYDVENIEALNGFEVDCSSTSEMAKEFGGKYEDGENVLIGSWEPFWIHEEWNVTHLKDDTSGEGSRLSEKVHIDTIVRNKFKEDFGEKLYNMIDKVNFDGEVNKMMYWKHEGLTEKKAAHKWVEESQGKIDKWFEPGPDEHEWCKHMGNEDMEGCPDDILALWKNNSISLSK